MKKILTILIIVISLSFASQAQSYTWLRAQDITNTRNFIWQGDTLDFSSLSTTEVVKYTDSTTTFITPYQLTNYVAFNDSSTTFATPYELLSYPKYSDSTSVYYTQHYLDSALSVAGEQTVFPITLSINGTLAGSVASAVEGTDYPTGWALSASGVNLLVNHGLGRYTAGVDVSYNTSGDSYRHLRSFDNAYSGYLDVDNDNVTIEGLTNFYTAYKIKVKIIFEQ